MPELVAAPNSIGVRVPSAEDPGSNQVTSMHTELFRWGSYLPEALGLAIEMTGGPDIRVKSAACSIGAEADSLLSIYQKSGYEGRVELKGHDFNRLAVAVARCGVYTVATTDAYYRGDVEEEVLRDMGFDTFHEPAQPGTCYTAVGAPPRDPGSELRASARPLREGHEVSFEEHDLRDPDDAEYDLVLANNVLFHLDPDEALGVIRNLASCLADNGVLSLGGGTLGDPRRWATEAVDILRGEYRLEPIYGEEIAGYVTPVMFGRS